MTFASYRNSLAIDTNVFLHLIDPDVNADAHINELLTHLLDNENSLIIDDEDRILTEYNRHLPGAIKGADQKGQEILILRAWVRVLQNPNRLLKIPLQNDQLMKMLRKKVRPRKGSNDRIFVYVAFKQRKFLVSNDKHDVVTGGNKNKKNPRRRGTFEERQTHEIKRLRNTYLERSMRIY